VDADIEDRLLVAVEDIHVAHAHLRLRHEGAAHRGVIGAAVHHRVAFPNPGRGPGHVFYVVRGHCSHGVLLSVSARYQRRSRRLRSHTAAVFITIKKASSTMMAAEVFSTKARSGLSDQRNICTGSTVAGDAGPGGMSTMKATMPIINSGAGSPRAWAMPMMAPVSMPGIARGSTWWSTTCMGEAPMPMAASRIDGGTALMAARLEMMMVGSVIRVSTSPPTTGIERGTSKKLMKMARPKRPKMMEGTAARLLMLTSMRSVQRLRGANSSR